MASSSSSREYCPEALNGSLNSAADKLEIDDFHPEQRKALHCFLLRHDVFVNLPTGFGKSAIFQAAPFCTDFLRGFADGKLKAFRSEYSRLGELRSLAGFYVPVVALTATATATTRDSIVKSLGMRNPVVISKQPRRDNIKFVVIKVSERDIFKTFEWKIRELKEKHSGSERLVIYCRTKQQCNTLYAKFLNELPISSQSERLFGKFHAQTDADVKRFIMDSFKDVSSNMRVLFTTVAFGYNIG